MQKQFLAVAIGLFAGSIGYFFGVGVAEAKAPPCMANDHGQLSIMNEQVLQWKKSTPNQYKDRAYVSGRVLKLIKSRKTHEHVQLQIGNQKGQTLEVIYNKAFGALPKIVAGQQMEACGDYITAREASGGYQASPEGAIIHWVHIATKSPDRAPHEDGFLMIDNVVYGNDPRRPEVQEFDGRFMDWMSLLLDTDNSFVLGH